MRWSCNAPSRAGARLSQRASIPPRSRARARTSPTFVRPCPAWWADHGRHSQRGNATARARARLWCCARGGRGPRASHLRLLRRGPSPAARAVSTERAKRAATRWVTALGCRAGSVFNQGQLARASSPDRSCVAFSRPTTFGWMASLRLPVRVSTKRRPTRAEGPIARMAEQGFLTEAIGLEPLPVAGALADRLRQRLQRRVPNRASGRSSRGRRAFHARDGAARRRRCVLRGVVRQHARPVAGGQKERLRSAISSFPRPIST